MAALGFVLVAACSSSDYGTGGGANTAGGAASATQVPHVVPPAPAGRAAATTFGAPVTGADGYPNINVDTARQLPGSTRTTADQNRLEAELLALGARQRSASDPTSASVIQELQDLGRRSKADAERQIESGAAPKTP